jgi:hypothetical protein
MTEAKKPEISAEPAGFDAEQIQAALGHKGTVKQGVLHVSVPRSEPVMESGVELPPSMGTASAINVQAAGADKVAATGDFVMTAEEVNRVAWALTKHGSRLRPFTTISYTPHPICTSCIFGHMMLPVMSHRDSELRSTP